MDGVLFDTIGFAQETFLKRYPGVSADMYKEIHSGNFPDEVKKYEHLKIKETEAEESLYRATYAEQKSKAAVFNGIKDLLEELHGEGYKLVLNTNAYERNCLPLLETSGLKPLFDFIATIELSKSKVEKFKLIEERYCIKGKDIIFITDSLGDLREADLAGIPTVAVTWGVHDETYFKREPHSNLINIVHSVKELRNLVL